MTRELMKDAKSRKKWSDSEPHKVSEPTPGPTEDPDDAYQTYRNQQKEEALKWAKIKKKY